MLTNRDITSAKPKTSPYYIWDKTKERGVAGKGRLGVQVSRAGSKSFKFRYFVNSKTKFIHIGSYPSISLAKARETAKKYSTLLEQGLDPKQELERQHQLKVAMQIEESKKASIRDLFESHRDHKKSEGKRHYQT
ncbi:Arm DNA-binding domain-containing protein, partial [Vibrio breoganii]